MARHPTMVMTGPPTVAVDKAPPLVAVSLSPTLARHGRVQKDSQASLSQVIPVWPPPVGSKSGWEPALGAQGPCPSGTRQSCLLLASTDHWSWVPKRRMWVKTGRLTHQSGEQSTRAAVPWGCPWDGAKGLLVLYARPCSPPALGGAPHARASSPSELRTAGHCPGSKT